MYKLKAWTSEFNWTMTAARFSRSCRMHSLATLVLIWVQAIIAYSRTGPDA